MEKKEVAVFGGGCFWCTEAVFKMLNGVSLVEPGYAGGPERRERAGGLERSEQTGGPEGNEAAGGPERSEQPKGPERTGETKHAPTYEEVSSGATGHAEVIRIEYDPARVSYETLLTVFF